MTKRNNFRRALKQLKSVEIEEKLNGLNEAPTNSMGGVYSLNPSGWHNSKPQRAKTFYPDKDGNWPDGFPANPGDKSYTRPAGWWDYDSDWTDVELANTKVDSIGTDGKSTEGIIEEDGYVKTLLPPGTRDFILGPLIDGFTYLHGHDAYTSIGYIQKDTRAFVLLGYIDGQWAEGFHHTSSSVDVWDGSESGFTSYNDKFKLEHALWFRDQILKNKYTYKVPYFKNGGTPQQRPWPPSGGWPDWIPEPLRDLLDNMFGGACPGVGNGESADEEDLAQPFGSGGHGPDTGDEWTPPGPFEKGDQKDAGGPWPDNPDAPSNKPDSRSDRPDRSDTPRSKKRKRNEDIAKSHGISQRRASEMSDSELKSFNKQMGDLDKIIDKSAKEKKALEKEARNIAIGLGVDVAFTLFGGPILKGAGYAIGAAVKGVRTANKARQVATVANTLQKGSKISKAAATAKATNIVNRANNIKKSAEASKKAAKLAKSAKVQELKKPNIFHRGNIDRSTPWLTRGASSEKSAKTIRQLAKDNIKGVDAQMRKMGGKVNPFDPTKAVRGMPGYGSAKSIVNPRIRAINTARAAKGRPALKADQINPGGFQTGPDEASRRLFQSLAKSTKALTAIGSKKSIESLANKSIQSADGSTKSVGEIIKIKNNPKTSLMDRLVTTKDEAREFGKNFSKSIESGIDNIIDNLTKGSPKLDGPRGQGNRLIQGNTNRNQGVTSPGRYNLSLATELPISIITGQPRQIPIAPQAAIAMGKDINANALANALTINKSTLMDAKNTIEPTGKSDAVFKGSEWGVQGGSTFNFNVKTNKLEIVSNKTLRTTSGGEQVKTGHGDNYEKGEWKGKGETGGKTPTWFSDIPELDRGSVDSRVDKLLKSKPIDNFLGGLSNIFSGTDLTIPGKSKIITLPNGKQKVQYGKTKTYNNGWDFMKDHPEQYQQFKDKLIDVTKDTAEGFVQGVASNSIAIRKALQNFEIKTSVDAKGKGWFPFRENSDVENMGGAFGQVSSKAEIDLNDLPPDVRRVIKDQLAKSGLIRTAEKKFGESYQLTEGTRRQLREIKKPYEIREEPVQKLKKYKPNFKGKFKAQNTPDVTASKQSDDLVASGNAKGQTWRTKDKNWSRYETQERMNVVFDKVGHGNMAWDMIVNENQRKNSWKNREIQEQLNIIAAEKGERQLYSDYESPWGMVIHEQQTIDTDKDPAVKVKHPLVKDLAKRLKGQIDYKDKPARQGYPNDPPPEMVDGWHPKLGKKYKYDKLDPVSARAMPKQGNPEIDANIDKASNQPKIDGETEKTKSKVSPKFKMKEANVSDWRSEEKLK